MVLLLAGCATSAEVGKIVADANLAVMSAELNPTAGAVTGGAEAPGWQAVSKKIEAFIAANPDQKATNAALRVRQAMVLLQSGQASLAEAAFDEADRGSLFFARDRALKDLQAELLWWYRTSTGSMNKAAIAAGRAALTTIGNRLQELGSGPNANENEGIRDFLAAMRATIGLKIAADGFLGAEAGPPIAAALNDYAATLAAGETARWAGAGAWPPTGAGIDVAIGAASRRRFRAEFLLESARGILAAKGISAAEIKDEYFRRRLAN